MEFKLALLAVICLTNVHKSQPEDDWVWSENNKNDQNKERSGRRIDARYDVNEPDQESSALIGNYGIPRPFRPHHHHRPPPPPPHHQPQHQRPFEPNDGNYGHANGVLVGPSYGGYGRGPFEQIDSCKCTERFNCPGLAYGNCDAGKQYCCVGRKSGLPPSRPAHSPENGILVGPGFRGDNNNFHGGYQNNDGFGIENGVLVGPGHRHHYGRGRN